MSGAGGNGYCSRINSWCFYSILCGSLLAKPQRRRSVADGGSNSAKSSWPIPSVEALFLPHFKLHHDINPTNYQIVKLLSRGAFGAVYEIINRKTQERWAMKVLQKSKILESDCVVQVKTEVEIQRAVGHHSFISSSPHFWQTKPLLFILFELANRGDLYEFCIKFGPLPEELCQIYIAQLALAIDFLHEAGVIHRDIKAENILLDSDFNVKVSDFGLAKWLPPGPNNRTYTICGTTNYIAPEVLEGKGYGHAADWWSLGQLACFLHTHKVTDCGLNLDSVATDVSKRAKDLLNRLLNPDPSTRLHSFRQITTISYYHQFNFESLKNKQMDPKLIIEKFASSALAACSYSNSRENLFIDFDKFDFF